PAEGPALPLGHRFSFSENCPYFPCLTSGVHSICTTGSVMVPCPWFPEMAAIARHRPDFDLGVHLTLTSEMPGYRWRPLTGVSANGLTDPDGFFWPDAHSARRARPEAVELEMRAQIDAALAAGIDVTHLDSHMGTVMMPEFLAIYLRLGEEYRLPILMPRNIVEIAPQGAHGAAAQYDQAIERTVARGNPDFIQFCQTPWGNAGDVEAAYSALFAACGPGLSWIALHFTSPGDIEFISTDAAIRIAEYDLFKSGRGKALMDAAGLELVGMRGFRDRLRASSNDGFSP
ncbi:ChbG/HpnK family deacetylase, partial [Inquilinus sp. NPDC058860]|uniref:ChbG/HpnK family deacetylase n=1 Tax=Inquilinus sp. NPDC058860 TaxID=3346652 RepID=UPI0036CC8360